MAAGKIKSNTVDAQEAISELVGVDASGFTNQSVEFGSSDVPSMLAGQRLTNSLMSDISKVVECVLAQANKFPELANAIGERDMADRSRFQ